MDHGQCTNRTLGTRVMLECAYLGKENPSLSFQEIEGSLGGKRELRLDGIGWVGDMRVEGNFGSRRRFEDGREFGR